MRHLFRYWGLSIVMLGLFVGTLIGQAVAGEAEYNDEQREHGLATINMLRYLASGHFWQAVGENWESEFLQMGAFVFLTAHLHQKGSPESKNPDKPDDDGDEERALQNPSPAAPWPVRHGGWALRIYSHSLSIAMIGIFVISFAIHAFAGRYEYSRQQQLAGQPEATLGQYMASGRFWFESMQNWQSEFLSIAAMVLLGIILREKGSPESKPVAMAHWEQED